MIVRFLTPWIVPSCASQATTPCGVADYAATLAEELAKHVDLQIVPVEPRWHPQTLDYALRLVQDMQYYRALGRQLNEGDLAHVQFQYPFFGGIAPYKNKLRAMLSVVRVPVVMTIHEIDDSGNGTVARGKRWTNRRLFCHRKIAHIIVHSREYQEKLVRLGIVRESVSVVPIPVPVATPVALSADELREHAGLSGKRVITIIGFIVPRKGYELAVRMMAQIPPDVVLVFAGGAPPYARGEEYLNHLKSMIATLRLAHRVIITGVLSPHGLREWICMSDLILAPFTQMSSSASVNLALAYHKPVIASNLPGFCEMNELHPCLELCSCGDTADLAEKCLHMLDHQRARFRLAEGARVYADLCSPKNAAAMTASIYRQLVGETP